MQQLHNESYGHPDSEAHTAQQSVQVKLLVKSVRCPSVNIFT